MYSYPRGVVEVQTGEVLEFSGFAAGICMSDHLVLDVGWLKTQAVASPMATRLVPSVLPCSHSTSPTAGVSVSGLVMDVKLPEQVTDPETADLRVTLTHSTPPERCKAPGQVTMAVMQCSFTMFSWRIRRAQGHQKNVLDDLLLSIHSVHLSINIPNLPNQDQDWPRSQAQHGDVQAEAANACSEAFAASTVVTTRDVSQSLTTRSGLASRRTRCGLRRKPTIKMDSRGLDWS